MERWRTWFLLSGSSESRGKVMADKRSPTGELQKPRMQWEPLRRGEKSRKPLRGDSLEAESCRTWPRKGWWRNIQAEGTVGAKASRCERTCVFGELVQDQVREEVR